MIRSSSAPVIIYGVADSYNAKVDEDGYQPFNLISSDLLPASVTFGIGLVGDHMLVGITISMCYNTIY